MRQKLRALARSSKRRRPSSEQPGAAEWLLENEIGRGFPNAYFGVLAGLLVAVKAGPWIASKIAARLGRRPQPPEG